MAQHIALNFYHHLLRERLTLGESLRRSKMSARQIAYPENTDRAERGQELRRARAGRALCSMAIRPRSCTRHWQEARRLSRRLR